MSVILISFLFLIPIQIYMCSACCFCFPFLILIQICMWFKVYCFFSFFFYSDPNIHMLSVLRWRVLRQLPSGRVIYTCTRSYPAADYWPLQENYHCRRISDPCRRITPAEDLPLQENYPWRRFAPAGGLLTPAGGICALEAWHHAGNAA